MKDRIPPKRAGLHVQLALGLSVAALAAAVGCAGRSQPPPQKQPEPQAPQARAQSVDLAPMLEVRADLSRGMTRAFPDYDTLVLGGVQQWNGKAARGGVVESVRKTYDTELDESNTWSVDATVLLFDTSDRAARELDASCYSFAHGGAASLVRAREGVFCISSVIHQSSDPVLHLPTDTYFSWVIARRDRVVLRMFERHVGSSKSAKNRIIAEIAERLGKLSPPASASEFKE